MLVYVIDVQWLVAHSCVKYDVHDDRGLVSSMDTFKISPLVTMISNFVHATSFAAVRYSEGPRDEFEHATK
jgi:hypothetical protein